MSLDLQTLVGGKPLKAKGTIENPGDLAHVVLDFEGEALPIDETLFNALPDDICKVVKEFQPTGSVGGHAHVDRTPPVRPGDPAEGVVKFDAELKLKEGCAMKWVGLPYPVSNLTGDLELHPDNWVFKNMRGSNGQAVISGSGKVEQLAPNQLKVDLRLKGESLPFDDQLRQALPPAWQKTMADDRPVRLVRRGRDDPGGAGAAGLLPPGDRPRSDLGHQAPLPAGCRGRRSTRAG